METLKFQPLEATLKEKIQKFSSDSIEKFFEDFMQSLGGVDPEFITSKLYKVKTQNTNEGRTWCCDLNPFEPINEDFIGSKFGGGFYKIEFRFYYEKNAGTKDLLTRRELKLTIHQRYNSIAERNQRKENLDNNAEFFELQNSINGKNSSELVNFFQVQMQSLEKRNNELTNIILNNNLNSNSNSNQNDIMMMLIKMMFEQNQKNILPSSNSLQDEMFKTLLSEVISRKNQRHEIDPLSNLENSINLIEKIKSLSGTQPEEPSIMNTALEVLLEKLPEIGAKLTSPVARAFPNQAKKTINTKYSENIEALRKSPEGQKKAVEILSENGHSQEDIKFISDLANVDLSGVQLGS